MSSLGIDDTFIAGFVCTLGAVGYFILLWLFCDWLSVRTRRWLRATTQMAAPKGWPTTRLERHATPPAR